VTAPPAESNAGGRDRRPPRRSLLAWCAFGLGVAPTGCGQLVAPVLAFMAWVEIRSSGRTMRGRGLAAAGVLASAAWCGVFVWMAQQTVEQQQQAVVQRDQHADGCVAALQRVAAGWNEARAADPWSLGRMPEGQVLDWLVDQGYVAPEDLCCPAAAARLRGDDLPPVTVRFVRPVPPEVISPDRCIVLYEDDARHRKSRGRGRHVLFADGHVDWLLTVEFRDALADQQKAAAAASPK
jgi:prepilin-type processing-associated H-X9-DG protein